MYPSIIVRLANEIKKALESGATLDDIRMSTIGLTGDVQLLRRSADLLVAKLDQAVQQSQGKAALKQMLSKHRKALDREIRALEKFVGALGKQAKRATS